MNRRPIHPALTGRYDQVDIGDLVRDSTGMLGIVIGTPGFYSVDVLWADGLRMVGTRCYMDKALLSRGEIYERRWGMGYTGRLHDWFKLWDPDNNA